MFKDNKAFSSFSVDNAEKAKEFYGKTLGLLVAEIPEGLELKIASGTPLFIYSKENHTPATFTVLNFIVDDITEAVDGLIKGGVVMEQYDMPGIKTDEKGIARNEMDMGPRAMAWFKDPAGNILGVMQEK